MNIILKENERIDDLQYKGLKIIQKKDAFCFGIDAVLVANFIDVRPRERILDLGTGTGIIPILLAGKTEADTIIGLEIQKEMAEMANRSVNLNKLEKRVKIVQGDIKKSIEEFGKESFDSIITNPPYMAKGNGLLNPLDSVAISRHEIMCTLEDVIKVASKLLKQRGQLVMVHRPERLVDIFYLMRSYGIEPKYIRFVHPYSNKSPNLILIKGAKGGGKQLKILEPLYVYDEKGKYTDEINRIYNREEETNDTV